MGSFAKKFGPTYQAISADIYKFCEALNFTPNRHQRKLFNAVMRAQYGNGPLKVAVKSGQGTGKTTGTCVVAAWRSMQSVDALTVLTAPTMRQCKDIWLAEFRRVLQGADPFLKRVFDPLGTRVQIAGRKDWGVTTVTATDSEKAQGFHQKDMTILVEEASGVDREIVEQFKGTASNPNCLFLMIGNPNTRDCSFFDCFHSLRSQWATMTFNAEETPKSEWFDPKRNDEIAEEFGKESDVYRIRVLGEFPHSDPNCVMSSEDLEKATNEDRDRVRAAILHPGLDGSAAAKQFGIDFSRYGGDESTIYRRSGNAILEWARYAHVDPSKVVQEAFEMQERGLWKHKDTLYVIDAGGMGQGLAHLFYDSGRRVSEFHNNGVAFDSRKFDNKVTEAYFDLAHKVKNLPTLIPNDPVLFKQLTSRRYFMTKKGKIVLESKDDYMKRGHDSPDRADGLVMCMYDRATVSAKIAQRASESTEGKGNRWIVQGAVQG